MDVGVAAGLDYNGIGAYITTVFNSNEVPIMNMIKIKLAFKALKKIAEWMKKKKESSTPIERRKTKVDMKKDK